MISPLSQRCAGDRRLGTLDMVNDDGSQHSLNVGMTYQKARLHCTPQAAVLGSVRAKYTGNYSGSIPAIMAATYRPL